MDIAVYIHVVMVPFLSALNGLDASVWGFGASTNRYYRPPGDLNPSQHSNPGINYASWYPLPPQPPLRSLYYQYRPVSIAFNPQRNRVQKPAAWFCYQYPNARECSRIEGTNAKCPRPLPGRVEDCTGNTVSHMSTLAWSDAEFKTTTFTLLCAEDKKVKVSLRAVNANAAAANGDCHEGIRHNAKGTGDVVADWSAWQCGTQGPLDAAVIEGETGEMQLQFKGTDRTSEPNALMFNCQCI
ncbi:uncharacterized protein LOC141914233 [Tubulanus polymorphus]|uniref:uncharacterized protein LOC141914233 n=1 Tax=Tubulanus polymorphus TaxID=672921 RepID=UPI003DA390A2